MPWRNILLITLENLRWDHESFANHLRDTTSNLRALVSASVFRTTNCGSHSLYTRSSTASILPGRLPRYHCVGIYRTQIRESISTIPKQLFQEGYWNVRISPNYHSSQVITLDRGFDRFRFISGSTIKSEADYPHLGKYLLNLFENSGELPTETLQHCISYLNNKLAKDYAGCRWRFDISVPERYESE
jgi:arylsulfatase A-like enzyme